MPTRSITFATVLLLVCSWAAAEPLLVQAESPKPIAADLVRKVRKDEAWIHEVKSFRAVFEDESTRPADAIKRRRAELEAQFPGTEINETKFPELQPNSSGSFQVAFDQKRLHSWRRNASREEMYFWDGSASSNLLANFDSGRTTYFFGSEARGESILLVVAWPRADHHSFWWTETDPARGNSLQAVYGDPEQWVLTGRKNFHGVDCHVLVRRHTSSGRIYIGVADGMLRGTSRQPVIAPSKADAIAAEVAKMYGGQAATSKELIDWAATQEKQKRTDILAEFSMRRNMAGYASNESWLGNYKEVAPGRWFPMTQGYASYHTGRSRSPTAPPSDYDPASGQPPPLESQRDMKAVLVEVDKPLPDSMFTFGDLKEGAIVTDNTKKPMLSYTYKKNMAVDEWKTVLDKAAGRDQLLSGMQKAQDAALNKPAPAFAANGKWMNTDGPKTWDSFKGKVVIVDLFAHWCGPCRNDYPTLVSIADQKDPNLVILGIHAASGAENEVAIQELLKEFKITYPIYFDTDGGKGELGKLTKELGVRGIPHTFVIGPDGKAVAHGSLGEVLEVANKLVRELKE